MGMVPQQEVAPAKDEIDFGGNTHTPHALPNRSDHKKRTQGCSEWTPALTNSNLS